MIGEVLARRIRRRLTRLVAASLTRQIGPTRPQPARTDTPDSLRRLSELPETLEYTGEFGAELILFLPWCHWLSAAGLLRERRIRTYRGMRCFYDDLDCREVLEKDATRFYVPVRNRNLPIDDEHDFDKSGRSPFHLYPDLRKKFAACATHPAWQAPKAPLLVVHNKFNSEWDGAPVNYIPLDLLDRIFSQLEDRFTIVYIRHGMRGRHADFSQDEAGPLSFDDRSVLDRHPQVACFDDLYAAHLAEGGAGGLNAFKNALYSRCTRFITTQGGGAHHIALFSGALMVIFHLRGRETEHAYSDGYYSFMASPAPLRVICRTPNDLSDSLALIEQSEWVDGQVLISRTHAPLLRRLSPWSDRAPVMAHA